MPAGIAHTESDPVPERAPDQIADPSGTAGVTASCLVGSNGHAEAMTQWMLTFAPGDHRRPAAAQHDQLLYVLSGAGRIQARGQSADLATGTASLIPAGEPWNVTAGSDGLHLSCVRLPAAQLPAAALIRKESGPWQLTSMLGAQARQAATSDREFEVLYDHHNGSSGATHFVGFIPKTGAPEHYHLYDEICTIIRGTGRLLVGDTVQDLTVGSTFHVPARFLHSVRNSGTTDLWILGVFRPAGSPAAAYHPDGRAAFSIPSD